MSEPRSGRSDLCLPHFLHVIYHSGPLSYAFCYFKHRISQPPTQSARSVSQSQKTNTMSPGFRHLGKEEGPVVSDTTQFDLQAPPKTDVWRTPPAHDRFDAPVLYASVRAASFRKARVTVTADWTELYDQGGLILVLPQHSPKKWVKAGIEMVDGKMHASVVSADRWADWSLQPQSDKAITLEFERKVQADQLQSALWVYVVHGSERRPIRKVTWVFEEDQDAASGQQDIWIGAYAARPHDGSDALQVHFSNLTVETA